MSALCRTCQSPVRHSPSPVVFRCSTPECKQQNVAALVENFSREHFLTHALRIDHGKDTAYEIEIEDLGQVLPAGSPSKGFVIVQHYMVNQEGEFDPESSSIIVYRQERFFAGEGNYTKHEK